MARIGPPAPDFAFFLIVPIILLNIVFGIILDTFAQLRTEREKVEEDMSAHWPGRPSFSPIGSADLQMVA